MSRAPEGNRGAGSRAASWCVGPDTECPFVRDELERLVVAGVHRVWVTSVGLAAAFSPQLSGDEAMKLLDPLRLHFTSHREETAWMLRGPANAIQYSPGGSGDGSPPKKEGSG